MLESEQNQYGRMFCMFLAEGLRSRRISLKRSADIAEHFLKHANLLHNELDFLALVRELTKDFEELLIFENQMVKNRERADKRSLDSLVKDFVVSTLPKNPELSLGILQDAASGTFDLERLKAKYPDFSKFTQKL